MVTQRRLQSTGQGLVQSFFIGAQGDTFMALADFNDLNIAGLFGQFIRDFNDSFGFHGWAFGVRMKADAG